ncbi:AAA domain-containing protein [Ignavibacterium sp.]|uniref:AAA domain-containing protein n=1 Tax=Ignavibacterium sp. TaxID=2651167 RepID=UPI00220C788A|nr:AAA domain-containing protein [Ignavibacterium sp.]BDQ01556.1 MAG: hypothetical protein KatS3mg037_0131 [Ignavibacterium sp.]
MKDQALFSKLTKDREENAKILKKQSLVGFKKILTEMYADKAHYIYELIQNADDAKAKNIKFILNENELFFIHNGTVKFSLTDPSKEEEDSLHNRLGHINAITSVGNTTKNEQKIGKFGVGFKSVFQYTDSPVIQDDNYSFQIIDFFVPHYYSNSFKLRKKGETLFYIPFTKDKEDAFNDSLEKLTNFDKNILLFLNNVEKILIKTKVNEIGLKKEIIEKKSKNSISANEKVIFSKIKINNLRYLQFSTKVNDGNHSKHQISIVYPLEGKGIFQTSMDFPAYCFFPTLEYTGFKFVFHAPFLLTDNRQNIKQNNEWNSFLIVRLSDLLLDSFLILRDEGLLSEQFFNILPLETYKYEKTGFRINYLFDKFYEKIKYALTNYELFPTTEGEYISAKNAYLVRGKDLSQLLDSIALAELVQNQNGKKIFPDLTESGKGLPLWNFLKEVAKISIIDSKDFINYLHKDFLIKRDDNWLMDFYAYCLTIPFAWEQLKDIEIIKQESGDFVKPFEKGVPQVFLKEIDKEFPGVKEIFLKDELSLKFLKSIGINDPDKKTIIKRSIISRYGGEDINVDDEIVIKDFKLILDYFYECTEKEKIELIELFKNISFIVAYSSEDKSESYLYEPREIYIKSPELDIYFGDDPAYVYWDEEYYADITEEYGRDKVINFLKKLGVEDKPRIIDNEDIKLIDIKVTQYSKNYKFHIPDLKLDGFDTFIKNPTFERSIVLWNFLRELSLQVDLSSYKERIAKYFYHGQKSKIFQTTFYKSLTENSWIYNRKKEPCKPRDIFIHQMNQAYDLENSKNLRKFLEIKEIDDKELILSDEEKKSIDFFNELKNLGLNPEEIFKNKNKIKDLLLNYLTKDLNSNVAEENETPFNRNISNITYRRNLKANDIISKKKELLKNEDFDNNFDELNQIPDTNMLNKLGELKKKTEIEAELIELTESLKETVKNTQSFSLSWFKALLELEYLARKESELSKSSLHLIFEKIERDKISPNILILSGAEYIPSSIEDNQDLSITITTIEKSFNLKVEAISNLSKSIKVRVNDERVIRDLDINTVERVELIIHNANFIFENLKENFKIFHNEPFYFSDDFNFKSNLPPGIEVIFGPPGTGKTYYLAKKIIYPEITKSQLKILVLTPTNKAADVLVNKVIEICQQNHDLSYTDWLIRFGSCNDINLENVVFQKSKNLKSKFLERVVFVTTTARFIYDKLNLGFGTELKSIPLKDFEWDIVILDESSMISLASAVFILFYRYYKNKSTRFIFSGDPFQINPIIYIKEKDWSDSNIFSLIGLDKNDSFKNPTTSNENIKIINLTKQYRSLPAIGEIFSKLTYNGLLEHNREMISKLQINTNEIKLNYINFVYFKVDKYHSFYKPHTLRGSPFHIYSGLLAIEFLGFLSKNIPIKSELDFSIGLVCPYRAQCDFIDKIITIMKFPKNLKINCSTIHGFQGDESDLIIAMFNPPSNISNSEEIFLNKLNIINVGISRAKDYLILFLPYSNDNSISFDVLKHLNKIKNISENDLNIKDYLSTFYDFQIEKIIFGKPNYLEEITFPTLHKNINLYCNLEKKYEIRFDSNAIDIQINPKQFNLK